MQLKDLKGTKVYEQCLRVHEKNEPIPSLVVQMSKSDNDVPINGNWGSNLWWNLGLHWKSNCLLVQSSQICWKELLTNRKRGLALKEGLIKFQPYFEGETTVGFRSNQHPFMTMTCLLKCFCQVTWEAVTGSEIRQVSGNVWPRDIWCIPNMCQVPPHFIWYYYTEVTF